MQYIVRMTKKASKGVLKLPMRYREVLVRLLCDLRDLGPVQSGYSNYSKLADNCYHCHLGFHWVICWRVVEDGHVLEVYYVGSRESAPY